MRWSEKGRVTGRRVKGGSFDPLQPQAIFWLTLELRAEIFLGTPGAWDVEVKWIGELERNEIQEKLNRQQIRLPNFLRSNPAFNHKMFCVDLIFSVTSSYI